MRIGLIADTHNRLRAEVFDRFRDVELILHAGDIGDSAILTELESIAPVHAVIGNTDSPSLRPRVQDEVRLELEGSQLLLVHGHRLTSLKPPAIREAYPDPDIIVYGHTHRQRVDRIGDGLLINPGAAGPARFDLEPSVAILTLEAGADPTVEHFALGPAA